MRKHCGFMQNLTTFYRATAHFTRGAPSRKANTYWQEQGAPALEKERLNVAKPGVKIGALMPLHTVCGMGTILFVACAPATNRAFLHPTSAPSAFQFMPPPQRTCQTADSSSKTLHISVYSIASTQGRCRAVLAQFCLFCYSQKSSGV